MGPEEQARGNSSIATYDQQNDQHRERPEWEEREKGTFVSIKSRVLPRTVFLQLTGVLGSIEAEEHHDVEMNRGTRRQPRGEGGRPFHATGQAANLFTWSESWEKSLSVKIQSFLADLDALLLCEVPGVQVVGGRGEEGLQKLRLKPFAKKLGSSPKAVDKIVGFPDTSASLPAANGLFKEGRVLVCESRDRRLGRDKGGR